MTRFMQSHDRYGPRSSRPSLIVLALVAAAAAGLGGTWTARPADESRAAGAAAATAEPGQDFCNPSQLELSQPHGKVLAPAKLVLRWRASADGPFLVTVKNDDGQTVFSSGTYGHEFRLLVAPGDEETRSPQPGVLLPGRSYTWSVRPELAGEKARCPTAEFTILKPEEARALQARFEAEARKLGIGDEDKEPDAQIALARLYVKEGFYTEAEAELQRLLERGWDDKRTYALLEEIYRKTDRQLSLRELSPPGASSAGSSS